jgi:HEAT repeat protein
MPRKATRLLHRDTDHPSPPALAFLVIALLPFKAVARDAVDQDALNGNLRVSERATNKAALSEAEVGVLIGFLGDEDTETRRIAAAGLARDWDRSAIDPLLNTLLNDELAVRIAAATSFHRGLPDSRFIAPLLALLPEASPDDQDRIVLVLTPHIVDANVLESALAMAGADGSRTRRAAAGLLAYSADERAQKAMGLLIHDADPAVRLSAATASLRAANTGNLHPALDLLESEDPTIRLLASEKLKNIRDESLTAPLAAALEDPDIQIVRNAVAGLLLNDPQTAAPFLALARDEDVERRRIAVDALRKTGDPRAMDTLVALLNDQDPAIRLAAIDALKPFRDAPSVINAMSVLMDDAGGPVAREALYFLCAGRDQRAIPRLIETLKSDDLDARIGAMAAAPAFRRNPDVVGAVMDSAGADDPNVRKAVAACLGQCMNHDIPAVMIKLLRDEDPGVRLAAAQVVTGHGAQRRFRQAPGFAEALRDCLDSGDPELRRLATMGLAAIRDPKGMETISGLLKSEDAQVRIKALKSLERSKDPAKRDLVLELIDDPDEQAREGALRCLYIPGDERNIAVFAAALADESQRVRIAAAKGLQYLDDERGVDALLEELRRGSGMAAIELSKSKDPRVFDALVEALKAEPSSFRATAAAALGMRGDPRAVEPLLAALNDDVPHVKATAARALGTLGDNRAREPLLDLLTHDDQEVRTAAADGLEKLKIDRTTP